MRRARGGSARRKESPEPEHAALSRRLYAFRLSVARASGADRSELKSSSRWLHFVWQHRAEVLWAPVRHMRGSGPNAPSNSVSPTHKRLNSLFNNNKFYGFLSGGADNEAFSLT
ncbi:hypothetical protein CRENBAI_009800 [Crenichthys baileyi]|uniref:Uncharacterized protein n=1 Tax=Crenichthys baileyi TaxID=28760 RepID=A0AAV9QTI3_9TELE